MIDDLTRRLDRLATELIEVAPIPPPATARGWARRRAAGPPASAAPATLQPPRVAAGEFAAIIQDPPRGFPGQLRGRIGSCGRVDTGARGDRLRVLAEVPYRGGLVVFTVMPWSAVKEPPHSLLPSAGAHLVPPGGNRGEVPPFLTAEPSHTHLEIGNADGTNGRIVGPYRVVRAVKKATNHTVMTPGELTGAQLAMAWNCDNRKR